MKMRVTLVTVIALAMIGVCLRAQFGNAPAKLETIKIKDDLFVIHNDFVPGNTTVLVTNEGVVLVDDKFEIDHDGIMAQLKKITNQPVKYVINTHYHADHSGGNPKLQALGAQVVTSENARAKMADVKQPGMANITLQDSLRLYVGGKRVEVRYYGRSHTDGDVVVLFPDHRVLSAGDMFTFGDATPELIDYAGGGSAKDWTKTLDGALQLDFDSVVPGHGTVTTKQEMRKFRDSTLTLRTRVHDMLAQNKSRAEIEKMLRTDFHFADLHVMVSLDGMMAELR
ncbi:MAG TPA: MBL fold metallo-hydrolase [Vicinamibacterales bacterium]|jgi:glyoxylase-like metal-dependent hydrolase (beta-lactamase superfamily II)